MLSIVVPLYNEDESLHAFYEELHKVLPSLAKKYEIVFVDDGSTDTSTELLKKIAAKDKSVCIYSFRKNHGKAEALTLGFQMAKGDTIVTLDADLQDRPDQINKLLNKLDDGFDLASGWRKDRHDRASTVISSKLFNFFAKAFWGMTLHDYNCGLKAYRADAAKSLQLYGGMHRFIPLISFQQGFHVTEVAVVHDERKYGTSKYARGFSKILQNLPDMFTMLFLIKYSKRPLHFFAPMGFLLFLIGAIDLLYLWFIHSFYKVTVGGRPSLFIGTVLLIAGLQVFFTGFLAELLINVNSTKTMNNYSSELRYRSEK